MARKRAWFIVLFMAGVFFGLVLWAHALEKFVSYRNYSPSSSELIPVTPDANYAVKQGYIHNYVLVANTNTTDANTNALTAGSTTFYIVTERY